VDVSGYVPGQRVLAGRVYRRIPNLPTHFDYETGRPRLPAFVPRPQDRGALSAHLDAYEADAALAIPRLAAFGLCALEVEDMQARTAGQVWVEFAPTRASRSHIRIHGCADPEIQAILAELAEMIHLPMLP
jgi:hypothetical protein